MPTLLLLRHAKSSRDEPSLADFDRPLNPRGRRDAPRMGRFMDERALVPDAILCSPARRTRETLDAVLEATGWTAPADFPHALYLARDDEILDVLRDVPDGHERVLVIAHNPGLEDVIERLTGRFERLPTAALAAIAMDDGAWADVADDARGVLQGLWRPKDDLPRG